MTEELKNMTQEEKIMSKEEVEKQAKELKVDEKKEDETMKTKWHMAEKVIVNRLTVETKGREDLFATRVRFFTDKGEITSKPREEVLVSKVVAGISTETKKLELYSISNLLVKYPVLKVLSDNCKEEPQEVVITYEESTNTDPVYKFMRAKSFETLYYAKFHKDDSNLKAQEEYRDSKKGKEI